MIARTKAILALRACIKELEEWMNDCICRGGIEEPYTKAAIEQANEAIKELEENEDATQHGS